MFVISHDPRPIYFPSFKCSLLINHLAVQVTVFAVGVTSGVNEEELETIASDPKCNNVHLLESFSDITSFSNLILKGACKGETHDTAYHWVASKTTPLYLIAFIFTARRSYASAVLGVVIICYTVQVSWTYY